MCSQAFLWAFVVFSASFKGFGELSFGSFDLSFSEIFRVLGNPFLVCDPQKFPKPEFRSKKNLSLGENLRAFLGYYDIRTKKAWCSLPARTVKRVFDTKGAWDIRDGWAAKGSQTTAHLISGVVLCALRTWMSQLRFLKRVVAMVQVSSYYCHLWTVSHLHISLRITFTSMQLYACCREEV